MVLNVLLAKAPGNLLKFPEIAGNFVANCGVWVGPGGGDGRKHRREMGNVRSLTVVFEGPEFVAAPVMLQTYGNQLRLRIGDDGSGLGHAVPAGLPAGRGLREMSEWAQAIGGKLSTQPGAHGGTAVKVVVA